MLELFLAAFMMVLCIIFLLARLNLRRWLGYTVMLDIIVTIAMLGLFAGTFSGVVAGAITGVLFSVSLEIMKRVMGYERLSFTGWRSYPPTWSFSSFMTAIAKRLLAMADKAAPSPATKAPKQRRKKAQRGATERIEPTFEGIYLTGVKDGPMAFPADRATITDDWRD